MAIMIPPPAGAGKWNQIEHRLFSFISLNWRGKLLLNLKPLTTSSEAPIPEAVLESKPFWAPTSKRRVYLLRMKKSLNYGPRRGFHFASARARQFPRDCGTRDLVLGSYP
jgi:hypothetical protein